MSIFGSFSTARSGLTAQSAALSVIGNNIANVSTVGFKGSRTEFADLLSAEQGGQVGKIGLGTRVGAIRTLFGQGSIEATGRGLDIAIEGEGFFVLRQDQGLAYTRAGNFQLQADGTVTNLIGDALQGTPVDATGNPVGQRGDIILSGALTSNPNPTTTLSLGGNLDANAATGTFDGTSFTTAYATSTFQASVQVFDALGASHNVTGFFTKTGPTTWSVNLAVDGADVQGGTAGQITSVGSGTITFDPTNGTVSGGATQTATFAAWTSGAAGSSVTVDLSQFTQHAAPSALATITQDGYGKGGLLGLTVDGKGILTGTFDNGQTRALYQLAIGSFENPEGLTPTGNQIYRESISSGPVVLGVAEAAGNGSIVGGALENSNVDLAQQFIDLISTQRAFQANAKVITTSDQALTDLLNVVR
ncbi:MAG TPA: flagellar hook protein FlgE [Candidatus Eisenbacteria bacterium]|nr:flagellar hook protein FlgE [Candidatus Eisenbacteria bacterium]